MTVTVNPFVAEAERLVRERETDPGWLVRARRAALERFERVGFPTTSDEEWRFTNVAPIAEGAFALAPDGAAVARGDLGRFEWNGRPAATLVFVNGRFADALSDTAALPEGVHIGSLQQAFRRSSPAIEPYFGQAASGSPNPFTVLNDAFTLDGALVYVPASVAVNGAIHLVFLTAGESAPAVMAHPRVLAVFGANSEATLVESYGAVAGARGYLTNAVTEIVAGESTTVRHYKVQREDPSSFHVSALYARAAKDATVECHSIAFGGLLVRNDVTAVLDGEGGHCTLNGLYMADGSRLVDNHTTIDHARAHCASREIYKGILADRARAVFNGKIVVRPDAQQTDAKQTNKALLLSEDAQINTKPQLEIFANDVKCTHGAAIGQIDDEAIFYLRARGIGEGEARRMLVRAFAADVVMHMPLEPLRARIEDELVRRLPEPRS